MKDLKEVNVTGYYYVPSGGTIEKQGTRRDIQKYLNQGYKIVYENNGYYVLSIPSSANVRYEVEDVERTECVKPLIRDYYNVERVTENRFNKFMQDYENNKFNFMYSEHLVLNRL